MAKITYTDKVDLTVKDLPIENKIVASDLNEIKTVVNSLDDEITAYSNGDGKTYLTLVDAMTVSPLPANNIPFTIQNATPTADDGKYIYLSSEGSGYLKVGEIIEVLNTFDAANEVDAGSMKATADEINSLNLKDKSILFDEIYKNINSIFNGTTSIANLDSSINLELAGDSIEFTVTPTNLTKAIGIVGEVGTGTSQIGFWTGGEFYVRDFQGDWLTLDGFTTNILADEEVTVKLVWGASNIEVFKNGFSQGTITKDKLIISNFGNAYNFFEGKIKDVTIVSNSVTTQIKTPYLLSSKTDVVYEFNNNAYLTESQINTLENVDSNTTTVNQVASLQKSIPEFSAYTNFNGTSSNIALDNTFTLEDENDFIEFTARFDNLGTLTESYGMGIVGKKVLVKSNSTIGVWFNGLVYIRDRNGTWLSLDAITALVSAGAEVKFKLVWGATDISVYRDDVFKKTITKGSIDIDNFGYAYNANNGVLFEGGIKLVSFKAKGVYYNYPILNDIENATKTDITVQQQLTFLTPVEKEKINSIGLSENYYELDITGSQTGDEKFTVYTRVKDNIYIGFDLEHCVDVSINQNLWRIRKAFDYEYTNGVMVGFGNELLQGGESEFTYRTNDGGGSPNVDFTGGFHGDEIQTLSKFYANSVEITDISSNIALTSCSEFYYVNKSNTYAFGTTTNETLHDKITYFENGGYRTFNRIEWLTSPDLDLWYFGLSSIQKVLATSVNNEFLDFVTINSDETFKLTKTGAKKAFYSNPTTGFGAYVESNLLNPSSENDNCEMEIWDRTNYTKYYRFFASVSNPIIGDVWSGEMVVRFNKNI